MRKRLVRRVANRDGGKWGQLLFQETATVAFSGTANEVHMVVPKK
jgi:hypothetical protein